jgi:hypothetical protein
MPPIVIELDAEERARYARQLSLPEVDALQFYRRPDLGAHRLFLYVLAWRDLRHRMDVRAGLVLGFAMTLKLFPGLMIFMLLAARLTLA